MNDRLEAFTVRKDEKTDKSYWTRIGMAFANRTGGYSIRLDALPVNGEIVLMPPKPRDDNADPERSKAPQSASRPQSNAPAFDAGGMDDDIPF